MSAGIILVDPQGRVLLQLRDDDPRIMFPGYWGITGGAGNPGETPEQIACREVEEETGLRVERFDAFKAYYFNEERIGAGKRRPASRASADYELYLFHAPCAAPVEEMVCGEGRALRFFAPHELPLIDIAYNHRDVLTEFFASPAYGRYLRGTPFGVGGDDEEAVEPVAHFLGALDAGDHWFEALMQAIALWEQPTETVDGRQYRYLVGGEAFDWLLLAERLLAVAGERIPPEEGERLLFEAQPPRPLDDARLRELIGMSKHRAHLNYLYGVTVEEALQYAVELDVTKERRTVAIDDGREDPPVLDPVFERIYGAPRLALLRQFREEERLPRAPAIALSELREFMYWLFRYRVKNQEPARVASDTRKALAQLSAMEEGVRRSGRRRRQPAPPAPDADEVLQEVR
jgi:8-oxo-dGTP pyrophosphatase MutT (NUDIX family)